MHLFQILLPLADNEGAPFPPGLYRDLAAELTERFGGLTAFTQAPAQGRWKTEDQQVASDDIVIFEVMSEAFDRPYWRTLRARLERDFRQERVIIRMQPLELV